MCNMLHKDSQPIPEKGLGYKIFVNDIVNEQLLPLTQWQSYEADENGIIMWKDSFYNKDLEKFFPNSIVDKKGFCFFLDLEVAKIAYYEWVDDPWSTDDIEIHKISYNKGLGEHIEKEFVNVSVMIALCQEFKIEEIIQIEEEK